MNKRLLQFITAENISQSQFADNIGVARASVSHIIAGRNKPGFDFVEKMARAFPALNIEWLITGRGKMYKNTLGETPQAASNNDDYAADLFNDAYNESLNAQPSDKGLGGNDLLDAAFMQGIAPADSSAGAGIPLPEPQQPAQQAPQTGRSTQFSQPVPQAPRAAQSAQQARPVPGTSGYRNIAKIIVFYDDGTYQELK